MTDGINICRWAERAACEYVHRVVPRWQVPQERLEHHVRLLALRAQGRAQGQVPAGDVPAEARTQVGVPLRHARRRRVRTSSTGAHPRVSVGCRYEHRGSVKANCAWRIATECSTARVIVCRQLTVIASPPETGIYLTKGSKIWVGRWEEKSRELRQRNARQPRIVDLVNVK